MYVRCAESEKPGAMTGLAESELRGCHHYSQQHRDPALLVALEVHSFDRLRLAERPDTRQVLWAHLLFVLFDVQNALLRVDGLPALLDNSVVCLTYTSTQGGDRSSQRAGHRRTGGR
jgi:hypothetical protein